MLKIVSLLPPLSSSRTASLLKGDYHVSVPELKAKWNSLCSQELRERTKEEKSKSAMGADELYQSNWQFMSKMRFVDQINY